MKEKKKRKEERTRLNLVDDVTGGGWDMKKLRKRSGTGACDNSCEQVLSAGRAPCNYNDGNMLLC